MAKGNRGGKRVYIRKDGAYKGMSEITLTESQNRRLLNAIGQIEDDIKYRKEKQADYESRSNNAEETQRLLNGLDTQSERKRQNLIDYVGIPEEQFVSIVSNQVTPRVIADAAPRPARGRAPEADQKPFVRLDGMATNREITSSTYKRAQGRSRREMENWMKGYR